MIHIFVLILIIGLAILQVTIVPLNLLFILVFVSNLLFSETRTLVYAFLAGMVWDLVSGSVLGPSSLGFLLISGAVLLYRRKISFFNPLVIFLFAFVFCLLFQIVTGRLLYFPAAFFIALLLTLMRIFFPNLFEISRSKIKI